MANDLATAHFSAEQMRDFKKHRLPVLTDPQSIASQQYGILALKVAGWMRQDGNQVLAITSATGGEGKSLTALNLSLAVASCSQGRVLLIDCDLRLPQVHTRLGLKSAGLSDLLTGGETDPKPYISSLGKLDIMASGSIPANPVNLLASARMRELLSRLRQDYQLIILDSPPVVPIADSHILAGLADGVLFVVRARKTRPDLFRHAIDSLSANNLFGVVLNDVEYASSPYAYAYRYYQQHYLGRS
jgi:non-specific protein-tyrosine kinase